MWIRRRYRRIFTTSLAVVLALLVIVLGSVNYWLERTIVMRQVSEDERDPTFPLVLKEDPLSLDEFTKVKVGIAPGKIYLVDNCTAVVMSTSLSKTFTIQRALEGALDIRPDAYDTFYDLMNHYEIGVKFVKIYELKDGLYYAQLFVEKENQLLNLDAKPSDALALATRFHVPIYVSDELLRTQSERVC